MKLLVVAGGTGGHLYPGIAVARAWLSSRQGAAGDAVLFAVRRGDLGLGILQKEGFPVKEISGQGLPRSFSFRAVSFPFNFLRGWVESRALLREFRPDWVVGMGGYLSVPVIVTARLMGIRTILHEQNVLPGLANRLLSRWADSVAVSFAASQDHFGGKNVWVSGLPIRSDMAPMDQAVGRQAFGLDQRRSTFLVFGGSLGARRLNSLVVEAWTLLLEKGLQFQALHITGAQDFQRVDALYNRLSVPAKVLPYCHDMPRAYAAADAVISRAGASTVAELLAVQRPALLVPYPYASNNHQVYNARLIKDRGLGQMVLDEALTPSAIADFCAQTLTDEYKRDFERAVRDTSRADADPLQAALRMADFLTASQ